MQGISSACVLVVIVFVLHRGVTASEPKIIPAPSWSVVGENEFLIQEGDELKIVCQGEGKIQFSQENVPSYIVQSNFTESFDEARGTYTFIRPRTVAQDTGWYACAEEGIEIKNDEQTIDHPSDNISWIYVYVNSSAPFVATGSFFEVIPIMAGSDGVVPCRPTSPDLPVILEIQDGDIPVPEDTTYDPKIGFILKAVGREHNGDFYTCKINGTHAEVLEWPSYYSVVEAVTTLPTPTIDRDALRHVVWGTNMTLECRIALDGIKSSLNWTVPSSIDKSRVVYPRRMNFVEMNGNEKIWKVEVTITDVKESDGGEYTCIATGFGGKQTTASNEIKIWDPNNFYLNISVNGDTDILSSEDQTVVWEVTIDTYPEDFTFQWYKEDGTPIVTTEEDSRVSKYSHTRNGMIHQLRISELTVEDSGQYTIRVSTPYNATSIVLRLTVIINMMGDSMSRSCNHTNCIENPQRSYILGQFGFRDPDIIVEGDDINVTCVVSVDEYFNIVTWDFNDFGSQDLKSRRIYVIGKKTRYAWQTILHIRNVSRSDAGNYTCVAVTTDGRHEREKYQLRVEVSREPEFTYTNMTDSEISIDLKRDENRTVTLDCRADGRPIPEITWYKNSTLLQESTQYRFSENNTKLQIEHFANADTDGGRYTCKAGNRIGLAERYIDIRITDSSTRDWCKDPGTSMDELERVVLIKQIKAAEAQERAAISLEAVAKSLERLTDQLYKRNL